jgi:hypothetical protein
MTIALSDPIDTVPVLQAALEVLKLLTGGWRRAPFDKRECDEYAPDVVRFWLTGHNWQMLQSATEGTSTNFDPLSRGSKSDRLALSVRKADLERGTDLATADKLHWYVVAKIYKRQGRFKEYLARRDSFEYLAGRPHEPSAALAEALCHEGIARALGWFPSAAA